ncbi:MAG: ABC transporter permease [Gammaproteobacteria bacterium]|jgi:ABC-type multidrug transport system permease subunit
MSRLDELRQLTWIRLLQFVREPEAVFWTFAFPVLLALVLGVAFSNRGSQEVRVGVVQVFAIAPWLDSLQRAEGIQVMLFDDIASARNKLRSGGLSALVEGLERPLLHFDPSRPEGELARLRIEQALQRESGCGDTPVVEVKEITETGARYIDFLIPGLLGMNLMATGIWGSGFGIVDMRQKKLLKLFTVTPMRRSAFLAAQILSRLIFLVAEVGIIVAFGVLLLSVPFRGSVLLFAILCVLGALCFSGIGLLVSSRARTVEGVSGIMNFVMLPMWLFSGVFFSYERFPEAFHPLIQLLPLTAINDGLRRIMLEGETLGGVAVEMANLLVWTAVTFLLAVKLFRWR